MQIIARVHTDFSSKFGVPRQSGTEGLRGEVVFEPSFRNPDAAWKAFRTSGFFGNFRSRSAKAGRPRCARRAWEAMCA